MPKGTGNIAIFGGTFDPFHNGHLRMTIETRETLGIDNFFLVPSARPPHKPRQPVTNANHRLAMVQAAVAGIAEVEVLDLELRREGPSYSFQTVMEIKEVHPGAEILFLIGADAFSEITSWRRYEELLEACDFLLLPRPGTPLEASFPPGTRLEPEENHCYSLDSSAVQSYRLPGGRRVLCPSVPALDISSSSIREKVRTGRSIRGLVSPDVERYITEHALYRDNDGG
ncbi:MAG: nicotinate-nucleotide adenylyltransferase [Syntrophorhabdaceae bacterium]|nr:nicotinate-nucleotide adenylyltransferase [Syntrophorhabdaceae bacterium]